MVGHTFFMTMKKIQCVETYDSFVPERLLDVNFRLADLKEPSRAITFRTSYTSIRQIYDGALTHYTQSEFEWMKYGREI